MNEVTIATPDGDARAFTFTPQGGQGPWPAVLFFMDGLGIRPALFEMAQRLADHGYYVLLPDMFWRFGPYEPLDMKSFKDLADGAKALSGRLASTSPAKSVSDTGAFLDFLSEQPQVKGEAIGTTGYCMGGSMSLRAAGLFPGRVAAAASIHGGGLAADNDDSPHHLAPKMKAKVLVAAAEEDAYFPQEQFDRLKEAFACAGVEAEVEFYHGKHGFAPPDAPVYDRDASERHWREMLALFDGVLKTAA
jgi:carboxymethylenebutenolidase